MPDLTKHAEAILRAADVRNHELMLRPYTREAILSAVAALHTEAFDAGAVAMREAAAQFCDAEGAYEQEGFGLNRAAQNYFRARNGIRAIDPTTLKGRSA